MRELGIPPAWKDVWICPFPNGHLQATGIDAAGRKQYRYHDAWRTRRDAEKFEDMTRFAKALPRLREQVEADLAATDELTRERVLACAVRLLDRGFFRVGTEEYTESFGLATIRKRHVRIEDGQMVFDYVAKSGKRRIQGVVDPLAQDIVCSLKKRRGGGPELLAYKHGRAWHDLRSDDINDYLKEKTGGDFSAKDFRTWSATVIAALALAVSGPAHGSPTSRKRAITRAIKETVALPRQHAGGLPRVLHRPARVRRLPGRPRARPRRDRRRAGGRARLAADPPPAHRARGAGPDRRARARARRRAPRGLDSSSGFGLRAEVVRRRRLAVRRRVGRHDRLLRARRAWPAPAERSASPARSAGGLRALRSFRYLHS